MNDIILHRHQVHICSRVQPGCEIIQMIRYCLQINHVVNVMAERLRRVSVHVTEQKQLLVSSDWWKALKYVDHVKRWRAYKQQSMIGRMEWPFKCKSVPDDSQSLFNETELMDQVFPDSYLVTVSFLSNWWNCIFLFRGRRRNQSNVLMKYNDS